MEDTSKRTCCICHQEFDGYGNNPWPVVEDSDSSCCDNCNWNVVIPARMRIDREYDND